MDNKFNIDQNSLNKLNDMMKNGDVSAILSKIPPDVMENLSSMMNNKDSCYKNENESDNSFKNENQNSFNFDNIDINTFMKMKSIIEKINSKNDPRNNLLESLKPYLRDNKKEKLDKYETFINFTKIAEILKNDNKESK